MTSIILLASFVRAITGFGFALVATPLLALIIDPKSTVVTVLLLSIAASLMVIPHMRRHADLKKVIFLAIGAIPGIFIGTYLLVIMDAATLKLWIAIVVLVFTIPLVLGYTYRIAHDKIGCLGTGFLSGVLNSSTSLGGPPIVLYLLNQELQKERFIGTTTAYFLLTGIISLGSLSVGGVVTWDSLLNAAILLPVTCLGSFIGVKAMPRINARLFKLISSGIIIMTALIIIVSFVFSKSK